MTVAALDTPPELPAEARPSLWLHAKAYDLGWYVALPIALIAILLLGSNAVGEKGPFLAYSATSVLTGLPHNMITWLLIMPTASRRYYEPGVIFGPFLLTSLVLAPAVAFAGTPLFAWALTIVTVIAYYHVTRQHMGLLHSSDARYVQATGDGTIRAASRDLRWLVAASAAAFAAWKLVGAPLKMGYAVQPMTFMLYPAPIALPWVLTAVSVVLAVRVGLTFRQRHREGKAFPASHLAIALPAILTLGVACAVPADQFYLTLALVSAYHNLQYFGYVYTHHHLRAVADEAPQDPFTKWARQRRWQAWFALPLALGVAFISLVMLLPPKWQIVATMWFMTSHYFVDGNIWRKKFYPLMGRFGSGRVAA